MILRLIETHNFEIQKKLISSKLLSCLENDRGSVGNSSIVSFCNYNYKIMHDNVSSESM